MILNLFDKAYEVAENTSVGDLLKAQMPDDWKRYLAVRLEDGTLCEIWLEEEESLALKAALVKEYNLGGIAAWVLGFERSTVWDVLSSNIE